MVSFRQSRPTAAAMLKASNNGEEHPASVLASSTSLFYLYREALDRCAQLSNRSPLLDLCGVFRKWLKVYSEDVLTGSLKPLVTSERRSFEGRRSLEGHGPNVGEVLCACAVLNTADYCTETAGQLQGRVQEKIHPDFRSKVTFEAEQDIFRGLVEVVCIQWRVTLTESGVQEYIRRHPGAPARAGDVVRTGAARDAAGALEGCRVRQHRERVRVGPGRRDTRGGGDGQVALRAEEVPAELLRQGGRVSLGAFSLPRSGPRGLMELLVARLVITKVTQTIVRCRPIPPIGAEQIILDLQALRTCLLSLPQTDPAVPAASSYVRYVTKSVGRLDTILKVVMTSEDPAEDFITHYLVLIPCQSFSDFQKMLDLKVRPQSTHSGAHKTSQQLLTYTKPTRAYDVRTRTTCSTCSSPGRRPSRTWTRRRSSRRSTWTRTVRRRRRRRRR